MTALRIWRIKNNLSQAALGKLVRASQSAVAQAETGKRIPRPPLMRRIIAVTNEEVQERDFYRPDDPRHLSSERPS